MLASELSGVLFPLKNETLPQYCESSVLKLEKLRVDWHSTLFKEAVINIFMLMFT